MEDGKGDVGDVGGKKKAGDDSEVSGKAKGGIARAEALSPQQRRTIAVKAATARWGQRPLRASHKGSFKEDFGIDVDCFVLDDEQKTAVISQRGMGAALGMSEGGSKLTNLMRGQKIAPFVGLELAEKLSNPLIFKWSAAGPNIPSVVANGYDVTILIDVCKSIIAAADAGKLTKHQLGVVRQAHVIVNASAKAGIKGLVYALAGYDQTKQEVIEAFKFYVRDEAREYEKEFPPQLYEEWYRLYNLPRPQKNKPWKFAHLTIDHVYHPLARSSGKVLELTRAQKAASGERSKKLHQFLSEIGVKALRTHLGQILGIAQVSDSRAQYERHVDKIFGAQVGMDFDKRP
jgi:hypothetical protein